MLWFWLTIHLMIVVLSIVWWILAWRLAKGRLWRVLVSIFMGGQMVTHLADIRGLAWVDHLPKAVYAAILIWNFFGLAVFVPLGLACVCSRKFREMAGVNGFLRDCPVTTSVSAKTLSRRKFLGATVALAPPLFNIGLTSVALAQLNNFRVRRFTLSIPTLPRALDGMTIAHVSDIHVGQLTSGPILRKLVATTNGLRPDLVLLTGDLIDYNLADLSDSLAMVKEMPGRYGQCMIEGNHDLFQNAREFRRRVKASGVPYLVNESAIVDVRGHPIQLFGLKWEPGNAAERDVLSARQIGDLMKQRNAEAFPILLGHHPHAFDAAIKANLPLTLCGHSHGGQLMLDSQHGVGPIMFRYWSGLYARGNSQLIVSNGVGNWFPLRINAPAEVVHLTLRCGAA